MVEWQGRFAASAAGNFPAKSVAKWKNQLAVDDVHSYDGDVMRIAAQTEYCFVLSAGMAYLSSPGGVLQAPTGVLKGGTPISRHVD